MSSSFFFPPEILCNILSRLPVKLLITLTAVCKSWYSLITHRSFIATHLNLHNRIDRFLLHYKGSDSRNNFFSILHTDNYAHYTTFQIPFSCETNYFKLAASFDGLICLSDSYQYFGRIIYLWNPSICKLKILRSSCFARKFRDSGTFFALGFGFSHSTNYELKIVRIMYFYNFYMPVYIEKKSPKVEIYSLATNSWRRIGTNAGYYAIQKSSSAYVNGAVHWFASRTGGLSSNVVLSFDFGTEKFGEILAPNFDREGTNNLQVSADVLTGLLILIVHYVKDFDMVESCCIWVMREYGVAESWTMNYSIVPQGSISRSLCIANDNALLMLMSGREVVSYDFDQLQFKHIGFVGNYIALGLVPFVESLVLFKEGFCPRRFVYPLFPEGGIRLGKRKWSVYKSYCNKNGHETRKRLHVWSNFFSFCYLKRNSAY